MLGGLNPEQRTLLLMVEGLSDDRFTTAFKPYWQQYRRWVASEGRRNALLRAKAVSLCFRNHFLSQPQPEVPFLKRDSNGFPVCIRSFASLCGNPMDFQLSYTILCFWRGILAPGVPDLTPIEDVGPEVPPELIDEMLALAPSSWDFNPHELDTPKHFFRDKAGPSGQAMKTWVLDLVSLRTKGPSGIPLIVWLRSFLKGGGKTEFMASLDRAFCGLVSTQKWLPTKQGNSRIAIKRERGGKDRLFALCDWWSQMALKPLHDHLMGILKSMPLDGTYDQDRTAAIAKSWCSEGLYLCSCDLTSATDRFPVVVLERLLSHLTKNPSYGKAWCKLMCDRHFDSDITDRPVIWGRGQPLGAYSSWPTFTLAHHLVVKLAAQRAGVEPLALILGDDIVLVGRKLSKEYQRIMISLGVSFSQTKGVTGIGKAEIAKRLFVGTHEVSPIPVNLVREARSAYTLAPTLYWHTLTKLAFNAPALWETALLQALGYKSGTSRKAHIVLNYPLTGHGDAIRPSAPWAKVTEYGVGLLLRIRRTVELERLINERRRNLEALEGSLRLLASKSELSGFPPELVPDTPVWVCLETAKSDSVRIEELVGRIYDPVFGCSYEEITFRLSQMDYATAFLNRKEKDRLKAKRKAESIVVMETLDRLTWSCEFYERNGVWMFDENIPGLSRLITGLGPKTTVTDS